MNTLTARPITRATISIRGTITKTVTTYETTYKTTYKTAYVDQNGNACSPKCCNESSILAEKSVEEDVGAVILWSLLIFAIFVVTSSWILAWRNYTRPRSSPILEKLLLRLNESQFFTSLALVLSRQHGIGPLVRLSLFSHMITLRNFNKLPYWFERSMYFGAAICAIQSDSVLKQCCLGFWCGFCVESLFDFDHTLGFGTERVLSGLEFVRLLWNMGDVAAGVEWKIGGVETWTLKELLVLLLLAAPVVVLLMQGDVSLSDENCPQADGKADEPVPVEQGVVSNEQPPAGVESRRTSVDEIEAWQDVELNTE